MNRRSFIRNIAALLATPTLPFKAVASVTPTARLPQDLAVTWADYLTKLHKTCTPEMLRPFLKVDLATAKTVHARLISQGILTSKGTAHPEIIKNRRPLPKVKDHSTIDTPKPDLDQPDMPTQTHILRQPNEGEIPALAHLWHTAWHSAHAAYVPQTLIDKRDLQSFETRLMNMLPNTRVIGPKDELLGFCTIRGEEVYQIFVSEAAQGTGVARALIMDAEQRLCKNGITKARLDCIPENDRAIAFYQKHGWSIGDEIMAKLDTVDGTFQLKCLQFSKSI